MKRTNRDSLDTKCQLLAEQARLDAEQLPPGLERDRLIKYARHLDIVADMNDLLSPPQTSFGK